MTETVRAALDRADPNSISDQFRNLKLGAIFEALPVSLRKTTTAASAYVNAGSRVCVDQQDGQCAASVSSAYARVGTGTPANLTVVVGVPAAGQVAIAPNGKVVTAAADIWTDLDVTYVVEKGDVVEFDANVVPGTDVCALPAAIVTLGVIKLLEAERLVGTVTGDCEIMTEGTAAAANQAELVVAKDQVTFRIADAVTSCRLKLLVVSATDLAAQLAADNTLI